MVYPNRNMEDVATKDEMTKEVLVEKYNVAYTLFLWHFGKECGYFYPCLKSLHEAKVKRLRLIALIKKVSETPTIDILLCLSLMRNVLSFKEYTCV